MADHWMFSIFDIPEMQSLTTDLLGCVHLIRWELTVDGQGTLKHIDLDMAMPNRDFAVKKPHINSSRSGSLPRSGERMEWTLKHILLHLKGP